MKKVTFNIFIALLFVLIAGCTKDEPAPTEISEASASLSSTMVVEGNTVQVTFALTERVDAPILISFDISGTATSGSDYQNIASSLTIPANRLSQNLAIEVLEDDEEEPTEQIILTLTSTDNAAVGVSLAPVTVFVVDEPPVFQLNPAEASSYMVNPNATEETVALFYNLKRSSESQFIVGQQDAFSLFFRNNSGDADMKKTTGSNPGMLGSDFMFITSDRNSEIPTNWFYQQEQMIVRHAAEAYDQGMVNTFSWHLNEPYDGNDFYTANMTNFQKENAFKSILPGGSNHEYFTQKLDKVAKVAKSMRGSDGKLVPFIFRPFHEFDGHWFWWGQDYCTAEEFITIWRFTVEYLRDTKEVNNMLFAFSPDNSYSSQAGYLSRYPGDDYVDVLGMDNYKDFDNEGESGVNIANQKLRVISDLAKERVKIAALTESGYFVTPGQNSPITGFYSENMYNALTNDDIEISYMMFWSNYSDTYCTPPPGESDTQDFVKFANKPKAVLARDIPDMYTLPSG